jgi:hypothetical protein
MHADSKAGGEKKNIRFSLDRSEALGLDRIGNHDAHGARAAMDRLLCTTLTERVMGFLERYDKSVYSFG